MHELTFGTKPYRVFVPEYPTAQRLEAALMIRGYGDTRLTRETAEDPWDGISSMVAVYGRFAPPPSPTSSSSWRRAA